MTRRKVLLIYLPLLIFLCGIVGFLFISSDYFLENYVKPRLISAIQDQIAEDYEVSLDELSGNILIGVEAEKFSLRETDSEKPPILSTQKIILKYNILGLLRRKLHVTALQVDSPKLNIVRSKTGNVNLMQVLQKKEADTQNNFSFAISSLQINEGVINFKDTQQETELSLPNIKIKLSGQLDEWNHSGLFSVGKGNLIINGFKLPIEQIKDMRFAISTASAELSDSLKIRIGNSLIDIIELKSDLEQGSWNTDIDSSIDASDVQKLLGSDVQLTGLCNAELTLSGTESQLKGIFSLKSDALSVKQFSTDGEGHSELKFGQLNIYKLNINSDIDLGEVPQITITNISAELSGGSFTGNGRISFDDKIQGTLIKKIQHYVKQSVNYKGNCEISDFELPSLLSLFPQLKIESPQIQTGIFNAVASFTGDTTGVFQIRSNMQMADVLLNVQDNTIPLKDSSIDCNITYEDADTSTVSVDGVIDNTTVDVSGPIDNFSVKLGNIDFGKLCKIANTVPLSGIGKIEAQIKNDGTVTGHAEIPNAFYSHNEGAPIPLGKLIGNLRYVDKTVYIENAHLTNNGQTGNTSILIDGEIKIDEKLPTSINIVANPLLLDENYNKLLFTQPQPIEGTMRGELKLYGNLIDNLDGNGSFTIENGKVWGIKIDPVTLPLEIDDYSVTISNFEITTNSQQVYINTHVTSEGEFELNIKNRDEKPVQLAKLALAMGITDFPLDGKMDISVSSHQKVQQDFIFNFDLSFTDITYENVLLGDANLDATLVKQNQLTGEPDYFQFIGNAFDNSTNIVGRIDTTEESNYQFTLKSDGINVSPILQILDQRLAQVTGTADSVVEIKGSLQDLTSPQPEEPTKRRIHPYTIDIKINQTQLEYNSLPITNTTPILIKLENDILTISECSLNLKGVQSSFVNLNGEFDTKNEVVNFNANSNGDFVFGAIGEAFNFPITGKTNFDLHLTGNISNPTINLNWQLPILKILTNIGDFTISSTGGEITYQNNSININPFTAQVFDNPLEIGGNISINRNNFNMSNLNIKINGDNLELAKYSDIIRNLIPVEKLSHPSLKNANMIEGNLAVGFDITGNISEPSLILNTHSIRNHPIRISTFAKPIKLEQMKLVMTYKEKLLHIQDWVTNTDIGNGSVKIKGDMQYSTQSKDLMEFDIGASVEKLEIGDFVTFFNQRPPIVQGTVSGTATLSGMGLNLNQTKATAKIDEINLHVYNNQIKNRVPLEFRIENGKLNSNLPISISSPTVSTNVDIRFDQTLTNPKITMNWNGTIHPPLQKDSDSPLLWQGNVEYINKQIVIGIEISNRKDKLTLTGMIPYDLTFSNTNLIGRFTTSPISIQLIGNELPITYFPGLDRVFSAVDGVTDINLNLKGTIPKLYLEGNISVEAPKLLFHEYPHPFRNVQLQLNARQNVIELTKLQLEIEDGILELEQEEHLSKLVLDGLTPQSIEIYKCSLRNYPLGSTLKNVIPNDFLDDVTGNITASLKTLKIPLQTFFENGEDSPIPKTIQVITFDRLTQKAEVELNIEDVNFGFFALDTSFLFQNEEMIPISLVNGNFQIRALKLKNTFTNTVDGTQEPLLLTCFARWNMHGEMIANLKLDNFSLSTINNWLPPEYREVYNILGYLTTSIDIIGTYEKPEVTINVVGNELGINDASIDDFSVQLYYDFDEQMWNISGNKPIMRIGNNQLSCSGQVPFLLSLTEFQAMPIDGKLAVTLDLLLNDLSILKLIDPLFQSSHGKGTINATISGTPETPRFNGTGTFDNVAIKIVGSPISLEDANAQFEFTESKIELTTFEGELNDGDISANGIINMDRFKINDMNLETTLTNCTFSQPRAYQITIDSDSLQLHGNVDDLILEGDLNIKSGYYQQDWNWEDVLSVFSSGTVSEVDLLSYAPVLRGLDLKIGIDIPNNFRLLSTTAGNTEIEIACSGQITGPIQEPLFTGSVSLLGGRIALLTTTFEIMENSTIRNNSTTFFSPELQIFLEIPNPIPGVLLSDGSTADLKVTASITGVLENGDIDNAKISLQAEPINSSTTEVFTSADVLALLLPGNNLSLSLGGFTFTITKGLNNDERHIFAEYPFTLFGRRFPIRLERDVNGEYGVDVQLLDRRF